MSTPVTLATFTGVWTLKSSYHLVLAFTLGMSLFNSFIAGVIQFKTLPRQMFGNLQSKQFPVYFLSQTIASFYLLAVFYSTTPSIKSVSHTLSHALQNEIYLNFFIVAFGMYASAVLNMTVVGPWTNGIMRDRHKLEREEGKAYNDKEVSAKMKGINANFALAHGVSSLLNLSFMVAALYHTAWASSNM